MRAVAERGVRVVVACMGAQMGKTALLENTAGWCLTDNPRPVLYVGPTGKQVRSMSETKFKPMIESTPTLARRLERGRRNRVTEKWIAGQRLGFAWAGSATELASHSIYIAEIDEPDRMETVTGEGDPIEIVRGRVRAYAGGTVLITGTPTLKGHSAIWRWWELGTRYRWAWTCAHCAVPFVVHFGLLHYDDASPEAAEASAVIGCPHCGGAHFPHQVDALNLAAFARDGGYLPHDIDADGGYVQVAAARATPVRSYWASGLCSPFYSFARVAFDLVAARGDPEALQAVINVSCGEPFELRGESHPWEDVQALAGAYAPGVVPDGVQLVTAGVDVQRRALYWVLRGWGHMAESWLLAYGVVHGETAYDSPWLRLFQTFAGALEGGRVPDRVWVDSGYKPEDGFEVTEHQVYTVCRRYQARRWVPCKGHERLDAPVKANRIDVTISGRKIPGGMQLWHFNATHAKAFVHSQLDPPAGEQRWHLPAGISEDYCKQIVAEELVASKDGRARYIRRSRQNHFLDCEAMAYAAAHSMSVHALPERAAPPPRTGPATEAQTPGAAPAGWVPTAPAGGWMDRYARR